MGGDSIGTVFSIDPTAGTTYAAVAKVRSISDVGGITITRKNFTHLASPNRAMEKKAGMLDVGEMTLDCIYTQAQYQTLLGLTGTDMSWQITFPLDAGQTVPDKVHGVGYISNLTLNFPAADAEDPITMSVHIQQSGKPVFVAGT